MKASISGKVTARGAVSGRVISESGISGKVEIGRTKPLPWYEGEYVITPKFTDQVIETQRKSMRDNVTVEKITTLEVDNDAGGVTYIFGA